MMFWIYTAGLVVLALALTLLPLRKAGSHAAAPSTDNTAVYKEKLAELDAELAAGNLDDAEHARSRQELEARLLQDTPEAAAETLVSASPRRWQLALLILLVPATTFGLYRYLGAPAILDAKPMEEARSKHDVDAMLKALEEKLAKNPEDAEGWYVLGRSYLAMQRIKDGEEALGKAIKLAPKEARYLSQYAEVYALTNGNDLQGKARTLVDQALEANPNDEKALELAGLSAFQRQELAQAAHFWKRLLKRLPADSEYHESISKAVKEVESRLVKDSGLGERAKLPQAEPKKNPH